MYTLLIILHVLVCLVLITIVLLQAGKGANMGAAFGGSSQTVFGSSGAGTFLGKLTAGVAIVFMLTSLILTYMANHQSSGGSLIDHKAPVAAEQKIPVNAVDVGKIPGTPAAPAKPAVPAAPAGK
jgi:preprotein translocase subunit SecG